MKYPGACIAVFARAPVPGLVKTRLIPALGADGACALHVRLLTGTLQTVLDQSLCHVELWVDQLPAHPAFEAFTGPVYVQQGADLGERLAAAARQILSRHRQVLFIGTDCPGLDERYLGQALAWLQTCEVVAGPATDGGYVLLAMRHEYPGLFDGIDWGGSRVMQQTAARAAALMLSLRYLPALADIDRPEDLALLPRDCEQDQVSR